MAEQNDKLARGFTLLARARAAPELLGPALLTIHGALEDQVRLALLDLPDLNRADRELAADDATSMDELLELARMHLGVQDQEQRIIRYAEGLRIRAIHGDALDGQAGSVLRYARFVEQLCDQEGLLDAVMQAERASRAAPPRAQKRRKGHPILTTVMVLLLIAGGIGGYLLLSDIPILPALSTLAPQTPVIPPTSSVPPPTPASRARLINIGAGPGWLHEEPTFDSGTLPIPLRDGVRVTVLDSRQTGPDGVVWQRVSIGGYEGWCPLNNLALDQ